MNREGIEGRAPSEGDSASDPSRWSAASEASQDRLAAFVSTRSRLLRVARRIVGDPAEAEDVVQDAWLRWDSADRSAIRDPRAFLTTATRRLAINRAACGASRREICVGTSPPEPVTPEVADTLGAEAREGVKLGLSLLSRRLSGAERAAYLLREVFEYEYAEIAEIIRATEVNSRQLVVRGRKHLGDPRRTPVSWIETRLLLEAFVAAAQDGDLAALEALLASDVVPRRTRPGLSPPAPSLRPPPRAQTYPTTRVADSSAA